jgi:serine/threonine protein kinase
MFMAIQNDTPDFRLIKNPSLASLVRVMLDKSERYRPTVNDIINHPWMVEWQRRISSGYKCGPNNVDDYFPVQPIYQPLRQSIRLPSNEFDEFLVGSSPARSPMKSPLGSPSRRSSASKGKQSYSLFEQVDLNSPTKSKSKSRSKENVYEEDTYDINHEDYKLKNEEIKPYSKDEYVDYGASLYGFY